MRLLRYFRPGVNIAIGVVAATGVLAVALSFVTLSHRVNVLEQALCRERLVVAQRTQPLLQSLTLPADPCAAVEQWQAMTGQPGRSPTRVAGAPTPIPSPSFSLGQGQARPASLRQPATTRRPTTATD